MRLGGGVPLRRLARLATQLGLPQLLWLPRSIARLGLWYCVHWDLLEEGSVEGTCALLLDSAQLLADKLGWQVKRLWLYMTPVPRASAVAAAAHPAYVGLHVCMHADCSASPAAKCLVAAFRSARTPEPVPPS